MQTFELLLHNGIRGIRLVKEVVKTALQCPRHLLCALIRLRGVCADARARYESRREACRRCKLLQTRAMRRIDSSAPREVLRKLVRKQIVGRQKPLVGLDEAQLLIPHRGHESARLNPTAGEFFVRARDLVVLDGH